MMLDSYLKIESQRGGEKILIVEKAAVFNAISHINTPLLLSRVFFLPWFDLFKAIYFFRHGLKSNHAAERHRGIARTTQSRE